MFIMNFAKTQKNLAPVEPEYEDDFEDEEEVSVGEEINETLTMLMPWAISFLFHCGLILIAIFVVWSSAVLEKEETVIPVSNVNKKIKPKIMPKKQLDLPTVPNIQKTVKTPTLKKGNPLSDPSEATPTDIATIGVSGNPSTFGHPAGDSDTGTGFMGLGGNAQSLAYVVDASGSMISSLPFVKQKLKDSIRDLNPRGQKFTVIFYQDGAAIEAHNRGSLARGLKPATAANKRKVFDWISSGKNNITPQGSSSPVKAISLAMSYSPDLIYILSDNITGSGIYAVNKVDLMGEIDKLQEKFAKGGKSIKINTIQFLYEDGLNTLEEIASKNDGKFKFIDAAFVGLE